MLQLLAGVGVTAGTIVAILYEGEMMQLLAGVGVTAGTTVAILYEGGMMQLLAGVGVTTGIIVRSSNLTSRRTYDQRHDHDV
jgi:hypothetical protein